MADEPDWRHPKIQALIGGKARLSIELQLVEDVLEEGTAYDATCLDMEYWNNTHDKLMAVMADAERYRFLKEDFSPMGVNIDGNHAWAYRRNATLKGANLDEAIDKARGK